MTQIALGCTALASLPVLANRKKVLLNPAFFVFLSVSWGVLAKALYVDFFRSRPRQIVHDQIYVAATSVDFLEAGAMLVLAAISVYVAGFFLLGHRTFSITADPTNPLEVSDYTRRATVAFATLCLLAFLAYLYTSGTNLFELPFSAKRFRADEIGVPSRFQYFPYYFFKLAMLSGPLAYAAAYLLARSETTRDERFWKVSFGIVFGFALLLSHFASLRLVILLVLLQIVLLLYHFRARRLVRFMSAFVLLTATSFAVITFLHRAPRDVDVVQAEVLAERAESASSGEKGVVERARGSAPPPGDPAASEAETHSEKVDPAPGAGNDAERRTNEASRGRNANDRAPVGRLLERLGSGLLEGRYFLDYTKLAHIAHHFPDERPHSRGGSLVGAVIPSWESPREVESGPLTIDRYLAVRVFDEPANSIPPGYAGELYIDFGLPGMLIGFLLLGAFHRLVFNHLTLIHVPGFLTACLVILIPNTTLVLVNSGILPAASRSVLGIGMLALILLPVSRRKASGNDTIQGRGSPHRNDN